MTDKITINIGRAMITTPVDEAARAYIASLLNGAAPAALASNERFRIGEPCLGGIFAGRLIDDQDRAYALIVAPRAKGEFSKVTWSDAAQRCAALDVGGFRDWVLPNRMEALAMFQRLHPVVKDSDEAFWTDYVYWTSEQHASDSGYAWYQGFHHGNQNYAYKGNYYRARAVRRSVIE